MGTRMRGAQSRSSPRPDEGRFGGGGPWSTCGAVRVGPARDEAMAAGNPAAQAPRGPEPRWNRGGTAAHRLGPGALGGTTKRRAGACGWAQLHRGKCAPPGADPARPEHAKSGDSTARGMRKSKTQTSHHHLHPPHLPHHGANLHGKNFHRPRGGPAHQPGRKIRNNNLRFASWGPHTSEIRISLARGPNPEKKIPSRPPPPPETR